jgi:hypothetical protein
MCVIFSSFFCIIVIVYHVIVNELLCAFLLYITKIYLENLLTKYIKIQTFGFIIVTNFFAKDT